MGDLVIKAAASNSLKIQSDNATNVLTVGTDDSVTLGTEFKVTSTSQTFTVKGIDAAITDSQTGTSPDTSDSDSGQLAIYNGSTKLWGITEHGYNVKPGNPSFHAYDNSNDVSVSAGSLFPYDSTLHNVGNHFNTSTYLFTAPISGSYQFNYYTIWYGAASSDWISLRVNGARIESGDVHFSNGGNNWDFVGNSINYYLNAGDYVGLYAGTAHTYHGGTWGGFSGFLVG